MKETINSKIGFNDSELICYKNELSKLTVDILAWNESIIRVVFGDVIKVLDNGVGFISAFCIEPQETYFSKLAIERTKRKIRKAI